MHGVALTSLWVAAWRAAESKRPDALFHDPFARRLAGPEGFAVLEAARVVAPIEASTIPVRTRFFDQRIVAGAQVSFSAPGWTPGPSGSPAPPGPGSTRWTGRRSWR